MTLRLDDQGLAHPGFSGLRFDGQVVAVSGAGHGLGRAIAEAFAGLGARVFGCAPHQGGAPLGASVLGEPSREVPTPGGPSRTAPAPGGPGPGPLAEVEMAIVDLTDRAAAARWIAEVEAAAGGPVSVLVNNAGGVAGQVFQPVEAVADADWDAVMAVNVGAAFALSRAVAPGMKRAGRGRIVTISSGAGLQASLTGIQAYASAKAGQIGFTRQSAHELGRFGITVNCIAPGFVLSNPSTQRQWESYGEQGQRDLVEGIAVRRLGTADDIANGVRFFTAEASSWVTGQALSIDGGHAIF